MSEEREPVAGNEGPHAGGHGTDEHSEAELAEMSRDELVTLGNKLDGVELIRYEERWPVKGTRAEKRAERSVARWFLLSAVSGLAFVVLFIAWPWTYKAPSTGFEHFLYILFNPLIGLTLGLSVLGLGVGAITYTKKFLPDEVAVQDRHDGGSEEVDRQTIVAELADAGSRSGIARRSMIKRTAGLGAGVMGLGLVALPLGGLIKNPWSKSQKPEDTLAATPWRQERKGEKVFLRRNTGRPEDVVLLKPADLDAGAMETVFPFRETDRESPEALSAMFSRSDTPVMLIRFRPNDSAKVVKRKGQEDFNYGDFYAFTKVCSHVGCPTSLYEQQTNRILCPCHQSQFDALHYAKPIFGPATRPLAQLPITVDDETGYLVAKSDFIEPIGPAYWERNA